MANLFHAPTRIVHGPGALGELPALIQGFGAKAPLVVTDPIIAKTPFFTAALDALKAAGIAYTLFDRCEIDARLSHIDETGARAAGDGTDCVVGIGGGSALCAAKGMAAVATNGASFRDFRRGGDKALAKRPLPNIMVPTTAGAGTEVSQNTIVLDDTNDVKMAVSSPLTFPDIAILDPATLATVPTGLGAASVVDALAHAVEAYLSMIATPVTDAYAQRAIRLLAGCARKSVFDKDEAAMADNHLAASMANIAFGNAGLGMAHLLGGPLESTYHITHGISVGVMLPRIVTHSAPTLPARVAWLATALGQKHPGTDPGKAAAAARAGLFALYDTIDFPHAYDPAKVDPARTEEMVRMSYVNSTFGRGAADQVTDATRIVSGNGIALTAAEARATYRDCYAG